MDTPGYWQRETGGQLVPAILRYMRAEPLTVRDLSLVGAYLRQWVSAPAWDTNPHLGDGGRAELAAIRASAQKARTRDDIDRLIDRLVDLGMDPL